MIEILVGQWIVLGVLAWDVRRGDRIDGAWVRNAWLGLTLGTVLYWAGKALLVRWLP